MARLVPKTRKMIGWEEHTLLSASAMLKILGESLKGNQVGMLLSFGLSPLSPMTGATVPRPGTLGIGWPGNIPRATL